VRARAVAEEAGTVNGSVSYSFGSMDGLFAATANALADRGIARIREGLGGANAHVDSKHLHTDRDNSMTHFLEHRSVHPLSLHRWWWVTAVGAGLVLGPLDLWGQVNTPYPWAHLFNSPAVWATAAFAYGRRVRDLPAAAVGAVIVLVVGVEAYYLADVLVRDANRSNLTSSTAAVWLAAGVVAGLVFGIAGGWAAETSGWRAVLGRAALPAILGAEAVHNLIRVATEPADGRPEDLGQFAVVLASLSIGSLILTTRGADRRVALQVIATTAVAVAAVGAAVSAVL
jgi:AcrR family transcriptional regulator